MHLTIFRKGLLLIAVPLLFQLVFIALLANVLQDSAEAERWTLHTKDVIVEAEAVYGQFLVAQTASRGHVITANPMFAGQAAAARAEALRRMETLERLVADNPAQVARVREARGLAAPVVQWQEETAALVSAGDRQAAADRITSLDGNRRLDALRATLNQFLAEENRLGGARANQLQAARAAQRWAIGGGVLGATLITCFVAWLFGRGISHRLGVVTRNAERLADNQPLADPLPGRDEIARLDAAVHDSARRLAAAAAAERAYKQELERRAAELAAANESLRQQTQENEMFVYSVSHDLRSPLVNLQGFSNELVHAGNDLRNVIDDARVPPDLRERVRQTLDLDVGDSIRFIKSAVTRSAAIIDALLRLSRAGRVEYRPQPVDVAGVIARVVDAAANSIHAKQARVVVGPLEPCWGDPTAVEQVFGNLVINAVNYLDPARPGRVEVGMTDGGRAGVDGLRTYHVTDNGLGIPAAFLGKVFVAFQRLHGDVAKGEGVGLALVRRVVERHGGRIWVESVEGGGTTFYVALPADRPAAEPAPADPTPAAEPPTTSGTAPASAAVPASAAAPATLIPTAPAQ